MGECAEDIVSLKTLHFETGYIQSLHKLVHPMELAL